MPLTTHCMNCGNTKTPDRYADQPHCLACDTALGEANQFIAAEKINDIGERSRIRQEAMFRRRRHPMAERHDPRLPFSPIDATAYDRRLAVKPGDISDPRRTGW